MRGSLSFVSLFWSQNRPSKMMTEDDGGNKVLLQDGNVGRVVVNSSSDVASTTTTTTVAASDPTDTTTTTTTTTKTTLCQFCGEQFASRNQMFKHLRATASDLNTRCGRVQQQELEKSLLASGNDDETDDRHQQQPIPPLAVSHFPLPVLPPPPPSLLKKEMKKAKYQELQKAKHRNPRTGQTMHHTQHCVWIGDLPLIYTRMGGKYKRLRALLRACIQRSLGGVVQMPWIKVVKRKAYRSKRNVADTAHSTTAGDDVASTDGGGGVYLGYAIVVFRDDIECQIVLNQLNDMEISLQSVFTNEEIQSNPDLAQAYNNSHTSSFRIKVRPVENNDNHSNNNHNATRNNATGNNATVSPMNVDTSGLTTTMSTTLDTAGPVQRFLPLGMDPPLIDQLKPLSTQALMTRARLYSSAAGDTMSSSSSSSVVAAPATSPESLANGPPQDEANDMPVNDGGESCTEEHLLVQHSKALDFAVNAMKDNLSFRSERYHQGRIIPDSIRSTLLTLLQNLRWAVPNHRRGLTAERYLVLPTKVNNDVFYSELRIACQQLMQWIDDPTFYYSGIAVTKNFIASPHIDDRDQSYQYAVSLGDFTSGGELCVDGYDETGVVKPVLHVINTHNRIAKIDGRYVHWVRSWEGGDRYSLIFYDTSQRNPTPVLPMGIDATFFENDNN